MRGEIELPVDASLAWRVVGDVAEISPSAAFEQRATGFAVATAVIVVAPVAEEVFFRAFFYRALRTRLSVWPAALIDGAVFGTLHFQGVDTLIILPVIAIFGVGQCLVYERTGSLFAVIAIHAAFNTVAMFPIIPVTAVAAGAAVILACALAPLAAGRRPSPVAT